MADAKLSQRRGDIKTALYAVSSEGLHSVVARKVVLYKSCSRTFLDMSRNNPCRTPVHNVSD